MSVGITYTAAGQIATEQHYPGAVGTGSVATTTYTYDAASQVASIVNTSSGTALSSFTYNYNAGGLVASENDNGSLQTYTYDATNQLLTDATPSGTQTLTYDATGNRNNGSYTVTTGNE